MLFTALFKSFPSIHRPVKRPPLHGSDMDGAVVNDVEQCVLL